MHRLKTMLQSNKPKQYGFVFLSMAMRFVFQLLTFFALARTLGAEQYGHFTVMFSFVILTSPLIEMGSSTLMVQHLKNPKVLHQIGSNLLIGLTAMVVLSGLVFALWQNPNYQTVTLWILMLSETLSTRWVGIVNAHLNAHGRQHEIPRLEIPASLLRTVAVGVLWALPETQHTAWTWSWLYLASSVVIFAMAFQKLDVALRQGWKWDPSSLKGGISLAFSQFLQSVGAEADKLFLSTSASRTFMGSYGFAGRAVAVAMMPMSGFFMFAFPGYFTRKNMHETLKYTLKNLLFSLLLAALACAALYLTRDWVHLIIGNDYRQYSEIVGVLALTLLLQAITFPLGDFLTAVGKQKYRNTVSLVSLGVLLSVLAFLKGMAIQHAVLLYHVTLTALSALAVLFCFRGPHKTPTSNEQP